MGRMYVVLMDAISVSAAKTLIRITAHTNRPFILHEVKVTQDASETSEQLPLQIFRVTTDGTGTAETPRKLTDSDTVFGGTAAVNLTAEPTAGTILWRESQNILNGWHYLPTPKGRPVVVGAARIGIRLDAAPGAALTITAAALIEEIG